VTTEVRDVTALPRVPAVYMMYGGSPRWVAYAGIGSDLRERIAQHLICRALELDHRVIPADGLVDGTSGTFACERRGSRAERFGLEG
jgi:hypothetical protein